MCGQRAAGYAEYDVGRQCATSPRLAAMHSQVGCVSKADRLCVLTPCLSTCRPHAQWQEARDALPDSIRVVEVTIDDSWLRDTAPTVRGTSSSAVSN